MPDSARSWIDSRALSFGGSMNVIRPGQYHLLFIGHRKTGLGCFKEPVTDRKCPESLGTLVLVNILDTAASLVIKWLDRTATFFSGTDTEYLFRGSFGDDDRSFFPGSDHRFPFTDKIERDLVNLRALTGINMPEPENSFVERAFDPSTENTVDIGIIEHNLAVISLSIEMADKGNLVLG